MKRRTKTLAEKLDYDINRVKFEIMETHRKARENPEGFDGQNREVLIAKFNKDLRSLKNQKHRLLNG